MVEGLAVDDNIGQIQIAGAVVLQQHVNVYGLIQNKAQLGGLVGGEGNGQPPGRMRALHQGTRGWKKSIHGGFNRRGLALEKAFKRRAREVEADAVMAFGQIAETVNGADGPLIRLTHGGFDPAIRC